MRLLSPAEFDTFANDPQMLREQGGDGSPLDNAWFFDWELNLALEHDGCCVPAIWSPDGSYDIHFLFPPSRRGKPALDAARAMLRELFTTYDAPVITGAIPRWNRAARVIIRHLGFAPVADTELMGAPAVSYALDKVTWLGLQSPPAPTSSETSSG